jgi:multidrug resistance efflux pump
MAGVTIDAARQQLIGLEIAHVERGPVGATLRTTGRVAMDETRIHHVNVKFSGFMDRVYADFVGRPVKKGEPIFSIYSPELVSAQEEYLLALRTRKSLGSSGALGEDGDALVEAARRKLEAAEGELRYQRHRKRPRGKADADIDAARSELAEAESDLARAVEAGRRAGLSPGELRALGVD